MINYNCTFLVHRMDNEHPYHLVCRLRWEGTRSSVSLNLGFVVDPEKFGVVSGMQCCLPRSFHGKNRVPASVINTEMQRYREAAAEVFQELSLPTTPDTVRGTMRVKLGIDYAHSKSTKECFDEFFNTCSVARSWKEGTRRKLRAVGKHITSYESFSEMGGFTEKNIIGYVRHLRSNGMIDTTVHRQVGYLRWFLKWCYERGYQKENSWRHFDIRTRESEKPVIFLTWEELMRVYNQEDTGSLHDLVMDMFLFSCFTSLRWSDISGLKWSQITDKKILGVQVKTGKAIDIELNSWSKEILSRVVDIPCKNDRVFPNVPNQLANRYLKDIAKKCGINTETSITKWRGDQRVDTVQPKHELITFHAGRRTFICQSLMMGIAPTTVMAWTGHSDFRAMKPYIAVADTAKAEAMAKWDSMPPNSGI